MLLVDPDRLYKMTEEPDEGFEVAFRGLTSAAKGGLRPFLVYVDKVLNGLLARDEEGVRCTHVHLPELWEGGKQVLLEFIAIRTFYQSLQRDSQQDEHIGERLRQLERMLQRNEAPADAKAAKGGNAVYRHWQEERRHWMHEVAFLQSIAGTRKSLWPDTILNIPSGHWGAMEESWYAVTPEDLEAGKKRAYCLLNDELSLMEVLRKLIELDRLGPMRQVILFDCEWKRDFSGYTKDALVRCTGRMPMKDLMILSFERRAFRLSNLINRMQGICRNYFQVLERRMNFPDSYVIQEEEVERLLTGRDAALTIEWVGLQSELFTDFLDLVSEHGAEALSRPSILNIYAGAINKEIAGLLLKDLFGVRGQEAIFPEVVRQEVEGLAPQQREYLQAAVSAVLEVVVHEWEGIRAVMQKQAQKGSVGIVVAPVLKEFTVFRRELKMAIPEVKVNLYTWRDIRDENCKERLVFLLAYRDSGRYPFPFYPNLFERGGNRASTYRPVLLRALFEQRYFRSQYNYHWKLNELLQNKYRYKYLDWKTVDEQVRAMKPVALEDIMVEAEEEDELSEVADTIWVDFVDGTHASYFPSRLLLVRSEGSDRLGVMRVDELPADVEDWLVQPLDELYEDINPFQIRPEEEEELAVIKHQQGIIDGDLVLWKVLLVRKLGEGQHSRQLYEELAALFGTKEFVQYDYFKDNWLDVHSQLLTPRKRRHFKLLCEYLKIGSTYYRLKLKKRASLRANSRESRSRMNALLGQMIAESLFESGVNWGDRPLEHLLEAHGLEEVGITEENLRTELEALVELLRDKIQLKQVQKIERP
jgi:hypothetical protein